MRARILISCSMHIVSITMEKSLKIIVIVLAITAVGLGYLISQRMTTEPGTISLSPSPVMHTPTASLPTSSQVSFTPDQQLILKPPPPAGSKKEDIGRYYAIVDRLAQVTDMIELGSQCYANPLVVIAKYGSKLTVANRDIYDHTINFDGPTTYTIPPKGSETIIIDFSHKIGLYAYVCDSKSSSGKIVGVLKVMP